MASGRALPRAAPAAAAGCLLAASAPLFVSAPGGASQQPAARSLAAPAAAGTFPEATASPSAACLVALGGVVGAAGSALAGRSRGGARHPSRCTGLSAEGKAAEKAEPAAPEPPAPAAEAKAEKVEPAPAVAEKAEKAEPAPAAKEKAPEPSTPAAAPPPPAPEKKEPLRVDNTFNWSRQIGVTEPLGFWDPVGFSKDKGEDIFKQYRAAELKHGRVAMMAALGAVVQHSFTFPGFDDVPRGIGAPFSIVGGLGFIGLLGSAYVLETDVWKQDPSKEVGDFGDPLNLGQYTEEMRNKELNNGRFAMFAVMGIILAENETGKDAIEQIFGI